MAASSFNLHEAVEKAQTRAADLGVDLGTLRASVRGRQPDALNSETEKRERRNFLRSLYDQGRDAEQAFERIIAGNELQDASFLSRGALVSRAILRIVLRTAGGRVIGYGTGFLIGDGVLITNNHVLQNSDIAGNAEAEAFYEHSVSGEELTAQRFALQPEKLWYTSEELDFSVVGIADHDKTGRSELAPLGWLPLIATTGKVVDGEWLTIVQHPKGERKQLCVRENQLLKRDTDVLWYSTDTMGGSSGSPVFNNDWLIVALHHSGVPAVKDGKWQTVRGTDYDSARDGEDDIQWIANEGIRVSRIIETLRTDNRIANHPRIQPILNTDIGDIQVRLPVMFAANQPMPELLRAADNPAAIAPAGTPTASNPAPCPAPTPAPKETVMTKRLVTLTLAIDDDGSVSLAGSGGAVESALLEAGAPAKPKKNIIHAPVDPARDWQGGFDPDFLGKNDLRVNLPRVTNEADIAPLKDAYGQTFTPAERKAGVLHYGGYSVVMNKARRFAFYSAANVNWGMRPAISGREDDWLFDDRIERAHQVDNSYYKNNKFDRGHLTRREDMEWGDSPESAVRRANGTCTWTNCTPQHSIFNQDKHPDKSIHLWQGLERYVLEQTAIAGRFSVQAFTGPVFGAADPEYRGIAYPLDFWKIVVAVDAAGKLFATGYVLGQKDVVDRFGLAEAAEVPFGEYGTYQRSIATIEDLTGLRFTFGAKGNPLREVDPLDPAKPGPRPDWRKRRGVQSRESFGAGAGDDALASFDEIVLG